ncbi:MAG: TetR/AcrR family transcriptional regulator [Hyphomonadaceae bacterium]
MAEAERLILEQGFAGATLDDILSATQLTRGAFFHHFASKAELAQAVVERYAENDAKLFESWAREADAASDDPRTRLMLFLQSFEKFLDGLGAPFPGCVFAAYTYQRGQFGPEMQAYIRARLEAWLALYQAKLEAVIAAGGAVAPVSARGLAELIVTIVEGGFVMGAAMRDAGWLQRQSAHYREYLALLFPERL